MNVPAILNLARVIRDPSLCLPHYTVAHFSQLPIPLPTETLNRRSGSKETVIKAIVLDKDNCFAKPNENRIHESCRDKFRDLVQTYGSQNVLIVSNSAGTAQRDADGAQADLLERETGVVVLRHTSMKPACSEEILNHFKGRISSASQIAVIGDRLFTDVVMANSMNSYSIWIRDGVSPDNGFVTKVEKGLSSFLLNRGFQPPFR